MRPPSSSGDALVAGLDRILRRLYGVAEPEADSPGSVNDVASGLADGPTPPLSPMEHRRSLGLMRVNHTGELCAQALYRAQAVTARSRPVRELLHRSAEEETAHLAWCQQRLQELGGGPSLLAPAWFAGACAIGLLAGLAGDRASLGFLEETERQVVAHLDDHLQRLPHGDVRSRAILQRMQADEASHRDNAHRAGAAALPAIVRRLMRWSARVMTTTAYRL